MSGCSGDLLPPSPPAEQATARQDQSQQAAACNRSRHRCRIGKIGQGIGGWIEVTAGCPWARAVLEESMSQAVKAIAVLDEKTAADEGAVRGDAPGLRGGLALMEMEDTPAT
jgi:hypothetical protein